MENKIKIAINWAGACGGCDVAILDLEEKVLDITDIADIIYWPVAMDFKREDIKNIDDILNSKQLMEMQPKLES